MEIGDNIRRIRKQMKITQVELAKLSGIGQSTISAIETGANSPTMPTLELISQALRCSVSALLEQTMEAGPPEPPENIGLTIDERHIISLYRQLSDEGKEYIFKTLLMAQTTMKKSPEGENLVFPASGD